MVPVQLQTKVDGKRYKATLRCVQGKQEHIREVSGTGEPGDSRLRLELKAVLICMERMVKPSEITVKTECGYIKTGFEFMDSWKTKNWTKSGGKPVANKDLWEKLEELCRMHKVSVYILGGSHGSRLDGDQQRSI